MDMQETTRFRADLRPSAWRKGAALLVAVLMLAACGDGGADEDGTDQQTTLESTGETEASDEGSSATVFDPSDPMRLVDGQLPPTQDGFPEGTITFWAPNDIGHTDDVMGTLAAEIAREISPVSIENRAEPSAPPEYGYRLIDIIRSEPRGENPAYHPMFTSHFGTATKPWTVDTLCEQDPSELEFMTQMATGPYGFVSREGGALESMEDVVEYLEENPDAPVLTSPIGSGIHAALAVFAQEAGLGELNYLPTDGSSDTRNVLLGEGAEFGSMVIGPGGEEGLNVLAVAGDQPFPAPLDDVPTMQELGWNVPGASARGFILVEGASDLHMQWLMALFTYIAESPEWQERNPGMILDPLSLEETQASLDSYLDATLPQLEQAGVTVCPLDRR